MDIPLKLHGILASHNGSQHTWASAVSYWGSNSSKEPALLDRVSIEGCVDVALCLLTALYSGRVKCTACLAVAYHQAETLYVQKGAKCTEKDYADLQFLYFVSASVVPRLFPELPEYSSCLLPAEPPELMLGRPDLVVNNEVTASKFLCLKNLLCLAISFPKVIASLVYALT